MRSIIIAHHGEVAFDGDIKAAKFTPEFVSTGVVIIVPNIATYLIVDVNSSRAKVGYIIF